MAKKIAKSKGSSESNISYEEFMHGSRETETQDFKELVQELYMTYAKSTIIERSCVMISGLKPVQQRILYAMHELGAEKNTTRKCARIVGDTIGKYHPHGDNATYGALVNLAESNENLNAAWVRGQGNLGKSWSSVHIRPAHQRYTEAALSRIASEELFRGLNDGSAVMVDNFDKTEKEPVILPVTFPSILVNTTNGIAVGISSRIPNYTLKGVCQATKMVINSIMSETVVDVDEFIDTLGYPDFITGGTLSINRHHLRSMALSGNAKGMYLSCSYSCTKDTITIHEIPHNTTIEAIVDDLTKAVLDGKLRGVKNVQNSTGNKKLGILITLNRGASPEEVIAYAKNLSTLRTPISYSIKFIKYDEENNDFSYVDNCGALPLLRDYWVPWRFGCVRKVHKTKADRLEIEAHKLDSYNIIKDVSKEVLSIIGSTKSADGKEIIKDTYGLDDEQVNYIYNCSASSFSEDGILRGIENYNNTVAKRDFELSYVSDDSLVYNEILSDLDRVEKNYSVDRHTNINGIETVEYEKSLGTVEEVIQEGPAWIGLTEDGYIKRTMTEKGIERLQLSADNDSKVTILSCENTDTLAIFTSSGNCYKLPAYRIENTRGGYVDSIWRLVDKQDGDTGEIIRIDTLNSKINQNKNYIAIMYEKGNIELVSYDYLMGPRSRYKSLFTPFVNDKTGSILNTERFFFITSKKTANWVDITHMVGLLGAKKKLARKPPRFKADEELTGMINADNIKYLKRIDLDRYTRDYCVKIGDDWGIMTNSIYYKDVKDGTVDKQSLSEPPKPVTPNEIRDNSNLVSNSNDDEFLTEDEYIDENDIDEDDIILDE